MTDIVERLRAPAYWISGSSEGHEGDNSAPLEAAAEIERLNGVIQNMRYAENEDRIRVLLENIRLRDTLREWESAIDRLSMRVGLTAKDIADVLNSVMDTTRTALAQEKPND